MTFDEARSTAILFGGQASPTSAQLLSDTWEWNGASWQQRSPVVAPSARSHAAMAYDPNANRTLLWGGLGNPLPVADTWSWDGSAWTPLPQTGPAPRSPSPTMTYDPARATIALAADDDLGIPTLWEHRSGGWRPLHRLWGQRPDYLLRDDSRQRLVAIVGNEAYEITPTPAAAIPLADSCPAGSPQLAARQRPRIGSVGFGLEAAVVPMSPVLFALSWSRQVTQNSGSCPSILGPAAATTLQFADARGLATQRIALPIAVVSSLRGASLFAQAATIDRAGAIRITNGLELRLGD